MLYAIWHIEKCELYDAYILQGIKLEFQKHLIWIERQSAMESLK